MSFTHRGGWFTFAVNQPLYFMQKNKITIDLKLPTGWEDLSDKQLLYVFALLSQGFTATEVKAYCLCLWAGLKWCRSHKPFSKSAIERAQCQACLSIAEREQIMQNGLWQDYGTGRETPRKSSAEGELVHTSAEAQPGLRSRNPRGNSGDLGRTKKRKRCKWFSRKYYASVMRIKEFYEDNIGRSFTGTIMSLAHSYGNNKG